MLTPAERAQLFAFPDDEGALIRMGTLSRADMTFIRHHRGEHKRLGIAVLAQDQRCGHGALLDRDHPRQNSLALAVPCDGQNLWNQPTLNLSVRKIPFLEVTPIRG
jgi:hypothetical protein